MKSLSLLSWIVALGWIFPASGAQGYAIDWHKIANGGGTSSNGVYVVSGTLGQADAGPAMTAGHYSITGGFWTLIAIQTPGSPLLSVRMTSTNTALVSWPATATDFTLQQNGDIGSTNWTAPPEPVVVNGSTRFINVAVPNSNRFYRLVRP